MTSTAAHESSEGDDMPGSNAKASGTMAVLSVELAEVAAESGTMAGLVLIGLMRVTAAIACGQTMMLDGGNVGGCAPAQKWTGAPYCCADKREVMNGSCITLIARGRKLKLNQLMIPCRLPLSTDRPFDCST